MTQCERVKKYMEDFGSITQLEAIANLGCHRLAARICDLREQGVKIETTIISVKNRYGETAQVAKYSLEVQ